MQYGADIILALDYRITALEGVVATMLSDETRYTDAERQMLSSKLNEAMDAYRTVKARHKEIWGDEE